MITADYHVHSCFSDGEDSPSAVAEAAFRSGMTVLGFADHGFAPYDTDCCIPAPRMGEYVREIRSLREEYRGRMDVLCGIEQDIYAGAPERDCDYVIGSVHYLRLGDEYCTVDWKAEILRAACENYFAGDWYALCEEYFRTVGSVAEQTRCDVIGHFDLVCKLNEREKLFDENDERYRRAWRQAADRLLEMGKPFEINTGAISRGYKSVPYPSAEILAYLIRRGARFLLSSDSHSRLTLRYAFDIWEAQALSLGAKLIRSPFE